jgi:hypothetical protein
MNLLKKIVGYLKIVWEFIKELPAASGSAMRS